MEKNNTWKISVGKINFLSYWSATKRILHNVITKTVMHMKPLIRLSLRCQYQVSLGNASWKISFPATPSAKLPGNSDFHPQWSTKKQAMHAQSNNVPRNVTIRSFWIVADLYTAVNVKVFSVDMEMQQWVPSVTELLNILTGVNGVKVIRSSCEVPGPFAPL